MMNKQQSPRHNVRGFFYAQKKSHKAEIKIDGLKLFHYNIASLFYVSKGIRKINPGIKDELLEPYVPKVLEKWWQKKYGKYLKVPKDAIANSFFRSGDWRGQQKPVTFYVKGNDVVVVSTDNNFITILKGGVKNARVNSARLKNSGK